MINTDTALTLPVIGHCSVSKIVNIYILFHCNKRNKFLAAAEDFPRHPSTRVRGGCMAGALLAAPLVVAKIQF